MIVEQVSSLDPDLARLYDLRIWVESDAATVLDAAQARVVGDWAREWEVMFVPSVALYLQTTRSAEPTFWRRGVESPSGRPERELGVEAHRQKAGGRDR